VIARFATYDNYPQFSDYLDLRLRFKCFDQGKRLRRCCFSFNFGRMLFSLLSPRSDNLKGRNSVWEYDRKHGEHESFNNLCAFKGKRRGFQYFMASARSQKAKLTMSFLAFPWVSFCKIWQSDNELLVSEVQKNWGSPTSFQRESVWKTTLILKIGARNSAWSTVVYS